MANFRRNSNGCRRGKFKRKPMGKGWLAHRRVPIPETPINRQEEQTEKTDQERAAQLAVERGAMSLAARKGYADN